VQYRPYPRGVSDLVDFGEGKLPWVPLGGSEGASQFTTHDGASILAELRGRTIFKGDEGRQNVVGWFESDHGSYRWLNDLVCIAEGLISGTTGEMVIDVYAGIHKMQA